MGIPIRRKFTRKNGYAEKDLLQYAFDHLKSARVLFERHYDLYDSAGYLSHLGIELILKAMILNSEGEFPGVHDLSYLLGRLKKDISLSKKQIKIVAKLRTFEDLCYPDPERIVEIGDEDWHEIRSFSLYLFEKLPIELQHEFKERDLYKKGGRIVCQRPKK